MISPNSPSERFCQFSQFSEYRLVLCIVKYFANLKLNNGLLLLVEFLYE